MDYKEYLTTISEVSFGVLCFDKTTRVKLHIIAPKNKNSKKNWTLVIQGSFFASLSPLLGLLFYEFISCVQKKYYQVHTKEVLLEMGKEAASKVDEIVPDVLVDQLTEKLGLMLLEIERIVFGRKLKNMFKRIYPYQYSLLYERPVGIHLMTDDSLINITDMHKSLSLMEKKGILRLHFPKKAIDDPNFRDFLSYKKGFYNSLELDGNRITPQLIKELLSFGLDEIHIPIQSIDEAKEKRLSGQNLKDILQGIKTAIHLGIRVVCITGVTELNPEYLKLVQALHHMGVRHFYVTVKGDVKDKDILLKQAYFYTNMNSLDLSLGSNGVILKSQMKRMNINPAFLDEYNTWYYMKADSTVYADGDFMCDCGKLSLKSLEDCYNSKEGKRYRKRCFKDTK